MAAGKRVLVFSLWLAMMTMTTMREIRARPAGRLGMASATSLRLEWVCTWWFWEQASWVSPAELTGRERKGGDRTQAARSNDQKGKWESGKVGKRQRSYSINNGLCSWYGRDTYHTSPWDRWLKKIFFWRYFCLSNYGPLAVDRKEVTSLAWSSLGGVVCYIALNEVRSVQPCRREE